MIKLDKPKTTEKHSISVDYTITAPRQTHVDAVSHNGRLEFSHLRGNVNCKTHNGKITCNQVDGKVEAETHNGEIQCNDIRGDLNAETYNGRVTVVYNRAANSRPEVRIVTHNDSIHFTAPPNLSAEVDISTHNGSIRIH